MNRRANGLDLGKKLRKMMNDEYLNWQERTRQLLGQEKSERLEQARVLIVGLGGVGGYAAEMLVRAGIGHLTIIDADVVQASNINRQLCALHSTLGLPKVEILATRFQDINPKISLDIRPLYLNEEMIPDILEQDQYDFIVDAIDTIAPKCSLIVEAYKHKIPIISSMGAGAKTDVTKIQYADLWKTSNCGLSKAVRTRLKRLGFRQRVPVVFSSQQADLKAIIPVNEQNKKSTTGTVSYMPAVFGCYLAQYVLLKL